MLHRMPPRWAWPLAGVLLAAAGTAWLVAAEVTAQRASFDTDARIAHRLLSQQAVQHDAMLAMLTLLQPAPGDAGPGPEQRLPALVPQVLQVLRRGPGQVWPADWAAAEVESAQHQRAVLAASDLAQGQYTLLRAGQPAGSGDVVKLSPRVRAEALDSGRAVAVHRQQTAGGRQSAL